VRVIETLTHSLTHSLGWCVGHEIVSERNTDGLSFRFKTQLAPDVSRQTTIERVTMLVSYHAATGRGGDTPTGWLRGGKTEYMTERTAGGMGRYGVWRTTSSTDRRTFVHVHFRVLGRVYPWPPPPTGF
jgi:hypothetical protein